MSDKSFSKNSAKNNIETYITAPANKVSGQVGLTLSQTSIPTKYFDTTSKYAKGSKEQAALFELGMGLHTIQDSESHAYVTNGSPTNGDHIQNTDYFGYVYNTDTKTMDKLKAGQVDERKVDIIKLTNNYIDDFLKDYGA